jgi:NitT/TauT family transport system substrate-binding protein|tara:strand:+ start:12162 stop:13181 length:1020 start_codon:yes stop_codon:yes gene_type:complete
MTQFLNRRRFLRRAGLAGLGLAAGGLSMPYVARAAATQIAIATNPGLENRTLNTLMAQLGYLKDFGADTRIVDAPGATGPFDTIAAGAADLCMVSGYNMILPRIEQGAPLKIVCAGMRKTALTVFARPEGIRTLSDLRGKTVAVGGDMGLLHALILQLLKEKGIAATEVTFIDKGSNDNCYKAVVAGEVDACCSSISHLNDADGLVVVPEGNMWQSLPGYTFQAGYASITAIGAKHEGLVAVMAAYGALYDYLMTPASHDAFIEARKAAQKDFDAASGEAIWQFNRDQRPYTRDLTIDDAAINYLQDMFVGLGSLQRKHPVSEVADMTAAREAARLVTP